MCSSKFKKTGFSLFFKKCAKIIQILTFRICLYINTLQKSYKTTLKKSLKKKNNVLKKCLPLQRFNKQMIVLQI